MTTLAVQTVWVKVISYKSRCLDYEKFRFVTVNRGDVGCLLDVRDGASQTITINDFSPRVVWRVLMSVGLSMMEMTGCLATDALAPLQELLILNREMSWSQCDEVAIFLSWLNIIG